jgi:hypothetical protein
VVDGRVDELDFVGEARDIVVAHVQEASGRFLIRFTMC